ncbi:SDR family NAD(P)-dependent oxidoreductase [Glutamicibacter nicotianae]|uniref:SDR family NAD(P)-dependent oxidoreductase n=1 Tax=Glutamicibacter nicotianae TaxID=37929 RepID=UPI0013CEDCB5|nr:SDR family oxidoreductase [Glutamicibacter nicotianae]
MNSFDRPLAVVTGATGGIGRAICLRLAEEGYDLLCVYYSKHDEAEMLRRQIMESGVQCSIMSCDLSESASTDLVDLAVTRILSDGGGHLKALVNCAALLLGPAFGTATTEQFNTYMSVNVRAPFFLSQRLSRRMVSGGSIVNFSSAGAHFSSPGDIIYSMSKSAIEAMSFHAAEALAANGIRINTVIPGFTDNGHELFQLPEARQHMGSFAVLGDVSEPQVVAEAVYFLVSERSSRTTGTTLDVSGGSTLGLRPKTAKRVSLKSLNDKTSASREA